MKKMPQKNTEQFNALKTDRINTIPIFDGELELDILANIAFNPKLQHKILYLTEDDFYSLVAINIYSIFYALYKKENVIDISAVRKQISFYHLVNRQYSVIPSQFDLQLKKLKELTYKRILQDIAYRITIMVEEGKGVDEIRNFYDSSMRKVVIKKDELDVDEEFENYITQKSLPVIKTGFPKLDRFTGGFMRGTYSIIASAQGVGKSTLLLNFLSYICGKQNKKVLYITLDMNFLGLYTKLISCISGISFSKMMFDMESLNISEWKEINNTRAKIEQFKLLKLGEEEIKTSDIRAKIKEEKDIDIVMIDYLQLLKPADKGKTMYETISNISNELKILSSEANIPFIVIASINRDYADRRKKIPDISDIRGSGEIEYDADLVLLLYRESAFRKAKDTENEKEFEHKGELIIAKNRYGESNLKIPIYFDGSISLIREMGENLF